MEDSKIIFSLFSILVLTIVIIAISITVDLRADIMVNNINQQVHSISNLEIKYKNDKYGFGFNYPSDWQLRELNPYLDEIILFPNDKAKPVFNKTISTTEQISLSVVDGKYIDTGKMQTQKFLWFSGPVSGKLTDGGSEVALDYIIPIDNNKYIYIFTGINNKKIIEEIINSFIVFTK